MNTVDAKQSAKHEFQAEVAQLLDLVVHSLYTDREIFVRELVSNASDALEKMRYIATTDSDYASARDALAIQIDLDEKERRFTIRDNGVGMTADEAAANLGTIAHSGSREFLKQFTENKEQSAELIGQFGVGFYSAFMVAEEVTVESKSYRADAKGVVWTSTGEGSYTLEEMNGLERGTAISLKLKESETEYAKSERIKELISRHSNFVAFPIHVDGEQVNKVQALWSRSPSEISDEQYKEFYGFIAGRADEPAYRLHFNADAPLAIRSILFVPGENIERFGMERQKPGVALYCKKVLIQPHAEKLLPDYFRFVQGVVDSEDLPLNISRESMQDSALMAKLRRVLTKRFIKFLRDAAKSDSKQYSDFFSKFGMFIKEGVAQDNDHREELAELLRFASSATDNGELVSLAQYVDGMRENQKAIYYISGASREAVEAGPYLESFKQHGFEVLYCFDGMDDFVLTSLREYKDKKLISADSKDLELPDEAIASESKLSEKDAGDLARWLKDILGNDVQDVLPSKRLTDSAAVLVNPNPLFTTGMQRIMSATQQQALGASGMILEIHPGHPILLKLNELRAQGKPTELAKEVAAQLLDNAMISAGLQVDPRRLVDRSTRLIERALDENAKDKN